MDLNLLRVLDVLLQEGSVTRAAARLGSSPAAVSRTLAKLRRAAGDPLLVRAGQGLVPTPRALELKDEVAALVHRADRILGPGPGFTPADLRRTFTVQAADLVVSGLAGSLSARLRAEAPHVEVIFLPKSTEDSGALRDGRVDLEIGAAGHHDPETRTEPLVRSTVLGVARQANPLFAAPIDPPSFAAAEHIGISRRGKRQGPIDAALAQLGLRRRVAVVVPGRPGTGQRKRPGDHRRRRLARPAPARPRPADLPRPARPAARRTGPGLAPQDRRRPGPALVPEPRALGHARRFALLTSQNAISVGPCW